MPEVNPHAIAGYKKHNIIANPELLDHADAGGAEAAARRREIERINVATYQSVSGGGQEGDG